MHLSVMLAMKAVLTAMFGAVDAKDALAGAASKAAAGAQRMAGVEPRQGTASSFHICIVARRF